MRKCLFASVAIVAMVLVAAGCTQNQDSADTEQTRQLTRQVKSLTEQDQELKKRNGDLERQVSSLEGWSTAREVDITVLKGTLDMFTAFAVSFFIDPQKVVIDWVGKIAIVDANDPFEALTNVNDQIFGTQPFAIRLPARTLARHWLSKPENVRFLKSLLQNRSREIIFSPSAMDLLDEAAPIFEKPFVIIPAADGFFSTYIENSYINGGRVTGELPGWRAAYGAMNPTKLQVYMWLVRRYNDAVQRQSDGEALVVAWQELFREAATASTAISAAPAP